MSPEEAWIKFQLLLVDNGAAIRDEIPETENMSEIKVGPDNQGGYKYMIDGVLSWDRFYNAAGAREAARRPQKTFEFAGVIYTRDVARSLDGGVSRDLPVEE